MKVLIKYKPDTSEIKVTRKDCYNLDSVLAKVILASLKKFIKINIGAPNIADEEVPDRLSRKNAKPRKSEYTVDSNHFKRWKWVLKEMIWSFEQIAADLDITVESKEHIERVDNGLRLFGKYFRSLWL